MGAAEICLSFIAYYPKIDLSGCYSVAEVKEAFEIFGAYEFNSMNMIDVENLSLYNGFVSILFFFSFLVHSSLVQLYPSLHVLALSFAKIS